MITSWAVFPTAAIAHELNKKTHILPNSPPRNTSGIVISILTNLTGLMKFTSSIKALKSKKQANDAVPTEYPLVFAFVTLP